MTNRRLQRAHTKRQESQTLKKLTPHRRGPNPYSPEVAKELPRAIQQTHQRPTIDNDAHNTAKKYLKLMPTNLMPQGTGQDPSKLESFRCTTKDSPNSIHKSAQHSTGRAADFFF
eukprot:1182214-Amphidinium_carterae.1